MTRRVLFVGGPGSGKTTVLNELADRGYACAKDSARRIIQSRLNAGLSPRPGPTEFSRLILDMDIDAYNAADSETTFFERGVPDAAGSLYSSDGLSEEEAQSLIANFPYDNPVFLFPPWQDIYTTDEERDHTFEHSIQVYALTRDWYRQCGYHLIEVPHDSPGKRADFVLKNLDIDK